MPTEKKPTTTGRRFTASHGSVFESGVLYAVIPGGSPAGAAHARARWVAKALTEAERFEWTGEGPTVEEVGEETLLAWDGRGWNHAVFEGDLAIWRWRDSGEPVLDSATHWRRVLKPPVAVPSER